MMFESKFLQQTEVTPPNYPFGCGEITPTLFHYTGFDNLLSVTESRELWATNIHYLNDHDEFKNALHVAKKCIQSAKNTQDKKTNLFLDRLLSCVDTIESLNIHVVSFTSNGDLLSQWRAYCPTGGVSVGFRYDDLKQLAYKNGFRLQKCLYEEKQKHDVMNEAIEFHIDFFKAKESIDTLLNGFTSILATIAPCFKNKTFEEEQEWRLVSEPVSAFDRNVGIRAKSHMMFPYYRFSLDGLPTKNERINLSFDRFIIGPSVNSQLADSALSYFLNRYNLSYDSFRKSDIPYRIL